jgi:hypothetical protein
LWCGVNSAPRAAGQLPGGFRAAFNDVADLVKGQREDGSGSQVPAKSSRRALRARSLSRQIRPTTVVSQMRTSSIAAASLRSSRNHASWTASSASLTEPSML